MLMRMIAVVAFGALAAGCATETRTVVVPQTVANSSCVDYGYTPGTTSYNVCIEREAAARRRGRMAASYAQASIVADSQDACSSYGLVRGTDRYDRCVQREITFRSPA